MTIAAPPTSSPIRLLVTDFDGTIVPADGRPDPAVAEFLQWVQRHRQAHGLVWVINTGRDWESLVVEMAARDFGFHPDWVVLVEREVHRVEGQMLRPDTEWNGRCRTQHTELFARTASFWDELRRFLQTKTQATILTEPWSPVGICAGTEAEAAEIHRFIMARLREFPDLTVVRNSVYFRFAHHAFHKGSCLQRIQQTLGLTAQETFAIGDHFNDLPMLDPQYARYLGCPDNAIPEVQAQVRAHGGHVAGQSTAAGILETWQAALDFPRR